MNCFLIVLWVLATSAHGRGVPAGHVAGASETLYGCWEGSDAAAERYSRENPGMSVMGIQCKGVQVPHCPVEKSA